MRHKDFTHLVRKSSIVALFLGTSLCVAGARRQESAPPDNSIYIGILDDAREGVDYLTHDVPTKRIIMPAFEKNSSGWHSIKSFEPTRMTWTVAFDGKNLGKVESEAAANGDDQINSQGSRAKQSILTPSASIPSVGKPSQRFAGVFAASGPEKFRRPLVAVSKPFFSDPDGWRRTTAPNEILRLVQKAFRRQYPKVDRCKDEEIAERNWNYPDSAIKLVTAYGSNKSSYLVAVHLDAGDCGWGGFPDDATDSFVDQWFFVAADKSARRIGGFDQLLDAGDYDNDGHSELIFFSMRSENSDAYDLVYGNFQQKAELVIGYH
jgi:hypothetical protein